MDNGKRNILWVDDEIEMLRPHIIFLAEKGYSVDTATNGEDAVTMVRQRPYDLVFIDEMMPGMGGLQTLSEMKELQPSLPIIMVTKNEAESLMEEAIGAKINDYLIKPVSPSQVLLICKKFLEGKRIKQEHVSRDYVQEFAEISTALMKALTPEEWIALYQKLVGWEMELDLHPESGLRAMMSDQKREVNNAFGKFVENSYRSWVEGSDGAPVLSNNVVRKFVIPELEERGTVYFFVIDCLRYDQWLLMESMLASDYTIAKHWYFSILPTATPYSRNAIFSGLFPSEIEQKYPEIWSKGQDDDNSRNRFEKELLEVQLQKLGIGLKPEPKYIKILDPDYGRATEQNISSLGSNRLVSIVVNFIDMLAHSRSDSEILREIAPNEPAYRSLTISWFRHSWLLGMFKQLARQRNATVIVTTDHGSVLSMRGAKVLGDREASTSLRYKYGRNLKVDDKHALFVKNPADLRLPNRGITANYIIAREDYYFVYPTDYHKYLAQYKNTFQHGGMSMEEMILPVVVMKPR
jgi:CheY-like chemotaxis protein